MSLIGLAAATDAHRLGYAEEALRLARAGGFRVLEGAALAELAAIHLAEGRSDRAAAAAGQALALHRATGHRPGEARALDLLAALGRS